MHKYGESKTTRIMMATVPHVISGLGLKKISGRWIFVVTSVLSRVTSVTTWYDYCRLRGSCNKPITSLLFTDLSVL